MRWLLILWLLSMPLLAQEKDFEATLAPGPLKETLVGRDPEKAVDLLLELYRRAGPRLGCRFVESCYLLTLADWRARGAWNGFLKPTGPEDAVKVEELNRWLVPHGLSLRIRDKTLEVFSLAGLEYTSERSRLEWMQAYSRDSGWAGSYAWHKQALARLGPDTHTLPFHYLEGFLLGYPDRAVEGYLSPEGDHTLDTLEASIAEAGRFECGVPVFDLLARDADDPGVVEVEQNWGRFLRTVYNHPQLRTLLSSPEFLAARRDHNGSAVEEPFVPGPNTADERLLARIDLAQRLEALPNLAAVSSVSKATLRRWVLRAGLHPDDPAAEVAAVVRRRWPQQVVDWVRLELLKAQKRIPRADLQAGKKIEWKASYVNFLDLTRQPEFPTVKAQLTPEQQRQVEDDITLTGSLR